MFIIRRKTNEKFLEEVNELVGDEYTILEPYVNNRTKINTRHNKCNHVWKLKPDAFLRGSRCPKCFGKNKKTTEQYKKEVFNLVGNEYSVLGEYINVKERISTRHNKCGYEWMIIPNDFLRGNRCPKCSGRIKLTTEDFKKKVFELVGYEYTVLGEYKNSYSYITMKHNTCDNEYEVYPSAFKAGNRCPKCADRNNSRGMQNIKKYLDSKNINYKIEETFEECMNLKLLPFDVYIEKCNLIIEYDGEYHFSNKRGVETWNLTRVNDEIKNDFCTKNKINLIRIPYWKRDEINDILERTLSHFSHNKDTFNNEFSYKYYVNNENWSHNEYLNDEKLSKYKGVI